MNIAKLCPREDLGFCNCYVAGDEGSPCFVVDPGYNGNDFLHRYIEKHHQGKCLGFLLTHAHYDHIFGLVDYPGVKDIPVFINAVEAEKLSDPRLNLSGRHGVPVIELADLSVYAFEDEDQIKLGDTVIEVIETPFHTSGSSCFYLTKDNVCFSGDTLFHLSIGRSDLLTGSPRTIESSLNKLKKKLNGETKIHPGHGPSSKFSDELRMNPFLSLQTR